MKQPYETISLNGTWGMDYDPMPYTASVLPQRKTHPIPNAVPGYWEDMCDVFRRAPFFCFLQVNPEYGIQRYPIADVVPDMALPNITGNFFYTRTFCCGDADCASLAAELAFEGAQNAVSAWINGTFLGRHEGYSAPFSFVIPKGTLHNGENTIVLSVSNHRLAGYNGEPVSGVTSRAACECSGGIYGNVEVRLHRSALRDVYVTTAEDLSSVTVHVETAASVSFAWTLYDGNTPLQSGTADGDFTIDVRDLTNWSPDCPKRYRICLKDGDYTLEHSFGIRRLTVDGVHLRLNGELICMRGICEHGYFPLTAHPCRDITYYRNIIRTLKRLGFNFIRFHTHIPMPEYMQAADELGMVMHVESPNNTSLAEWKEIVRYCRRYTAPVIYCCGNELMMDDPFIAHQHQCADAVHAGTDALFSPMSAMRGVEYMWTEPGIEKETVDVPFRHNPRRLGILSQFCDLYSSYANERLSYNSLDADPAEQDVWSDVYGKPRLSHEICIHGTYADLSIKDRYRGTRIGETELFTSVERHLEDVGLLDRAPVYYKHSCEWQRRLRKHCFEACRASKKLAGFDYLGDIDHHWHTFGYNVGMMNEFYELKPGETVRNVRMYNGDTVLLCDLGTDFNFTAGDMLETNLSVSNYGGEIRGASLTMRLTDVSSDRTLYRRTVKVGDLQNGFVGAVHQLKVRLPKCEKPMALKLYVSLSGGDRDAENEWELYVFPKPKARKLPQNLVVSNGIDGDTLLSALESGYDVVLFAADPEKLPFAAQKTSFRISLAGRTHGNLATILADHPALDDLPHEGFCGWQFRRMLEGSAVQFCDGVPFDPILDVANTHKNAQRLASIFEYAVCGSEGKTAKLLVCTLRFSDDDPAAVWLKDALLSYAAGDGFLPRQTVTTMQLAAMFDRTASYTAVNTNVAFNPNDKTMRRRT